MNLLVVLGAWFAAGVLATLVLGPRLRRAAEQAGVPLEPEPVYAADRSPLRWRLGTLGVVGLLAGSTGMAAAGALPGSAQTIAHHVLGTVGVHVPEAGDAPAEVATGPAPTPSSDAAPSTSSPGPGGGDRSADPLPPAPPADDGQDLAAADPDGSGTETGATTESTAPSEHESAATTTSEPSPRPEGSDVPDETTPPSDEPSDVPDDPSVEEPPTTTPPGEEQPPPEDPDDPTTTTTTTSTSTTLPPPPPPDEPAG